MKDFLLEEKIEELNQLQSSCTHCGLCLEGCATFQATGWEHESPRGRLKLVEQFIHGNIPLDSDALATFDRCLGCRVCEETCPQKTPYSKVRALIQEVRRDLTLCRQAQMTEAGYGAWITAAYRISSSRWRRFFSKWISIPLFESCKNGSFSQKQKLPREGRAVLSVCCVQDLFMHEQIEQAMTFTRLLGEELWIDPKQPCCGAIFERLVHGGGESVCYPDKQRKAAILQTNTEEAFEKWKPDQVYFLSGACQAHASSGSSKEDLYAWLNAVMDRKGIFLRLSSPRVVYYQPYCRAAKNNRDFILQLLKRVEGLTVCEMPFPQACCGGYCGEVLLHQEHSSTMFEAKTKTIPAEAVIVVSSPDCWGLFKKCSIERNLKICTPFQILLEATLV